VKPSWRPPGGTSTGIPIWRLELISLNVASHAVLTEWRVHTSRPDELTGIPAPRMRAHPTGSQGVRAHHGQLGGAADRHVVDVHLL
jgi:hypothetical protein